LNHLGTSDDFDSLAIAFKIALLGNIQQDS